MGARGYFLAAVLFVLMGLSGVAWAGEYVCQFTGSANGSTAPGTAAVACGVSDNATATASSAFGYTNTASGYGSLAIGYGNVASGRLSNVIGALSSAAGEDSSAFGTHTQIGTGASYSIAFGAGSSDADGAIIYNSVTSSVAVGRAAHVAANDSVGIGHGASVRTGSTSAVALGTSATVLAADSISIGHDSTVQAGATGALAIGSGSIADAANTLSIGSPTLQRRIVNLAAGTADTDAVNLSQLGTVTAAFGGGASFAGSVFLAPIFTIQGTSYNNVGAAFSGVDDSLTDLYQKVAAAIPPPREVVYDQDSGDTLTLTGANGTAIANVAAGAAATDAANVGQVQTGDAATLQSANQYTDLQVKSGDAATLASANTYTDAQTQEALASAKTYADAGDSATLAQANAYTDSKLAAGFVTRDAFEQFRQQVGERFHQMDVRMARIGAMGQAIGGMAGAIAGGDRTPNRVSAAAGSYGGQNAMAVGYSHLLPGHGSVLVGGTVASGGGTGGTVGVSFGW